MQTHYLALSLHGFFAEFAEETPVVFAEEKPVVFAEDKPVVPAEDKPVVSAEENPVACQEIPMAWTRQGRRPCVVNGIGISWQATGFSSADTTGLSSADTTGFSSANTTGLSSANTTGVSSNDVESNTLNWSCSCISGGGPGSQVLRLRIK